MDADIETIIARLVEFRDKRNWAQFHNLKDLALALSIEVAELNEVFLWKKTDEADKARIADELADVFAFAFLLAHEAKLDVKKIVVKKIKENAKRYPVHKSKNNALKYDRL